MEIFNSNKIEEAHYENGVLYFKVHGVWAWMLFNPYDRTTDTE